MMTRYFEGGMLHYSMVVLVMVVVMVVVLVEKETRMRRYMGPERNTGAVSCRRILANLHGRVPECVYFGGAL